MSDCDPATQPRVPSLPALVESWPAQPSTSHEPSWFADPGAEPASASADGPGLFTRERQVEFLHALAATGAVRPAAKRAGVSHQTAYRARLAEPSFRRAWDAALLAARCHAEEVLSCRAIDGVEEQVWYHGEVVATRRRFDSRLLLAHLARLDRLTADARVEAFAGDFEAALGRFGAGSDTPEEAPPPEPDKKSPGQWSKRSTPGSLEAEPRKAKPFKTKPLKKCPECGGRCLGPENALTEEDCQWLGNRLARMDAARPHGAMLPDEFIGYDGGEVEAEQLAAFEAGEDDWWRIVPPEPDDDPGDWHFAK